MRRVLPRATVDDEWTWFDIQLCQPAGSSPATVSGRNPDTGLSLSPTSKYGPCTGKVRTLYLCSISLHRGLPRGLKSGVETDPH